MSATLNMFDLIFIFSTLAILVLAFFRGFVREIFSLINWILAIFLMFLISPFLSNIFAKFIDNKIVANIVSSSMVFIIIFIISSLTTRKFALILKEKIPLTTDQILGVVYGFLKSFLIFGLIYSIIINSHILIYQKSKKSMPDWLYASKTRILIMPFAKTLNPIVKALFIESKERFIEDSNYKNPAKPTKSTKESEKSFSKEENKPFEIFEKNSSKADKIIEEKGYSKKEIEKMDRLIEIIE